MALSPDLKVADVGEYRVDPETGEILEYEVREAFTIDSLERLEWFLAKLGNLEAEAHAIDNTDVVRQARAIIENADAMRKPIVAKVAALRRRFEPEVKEFASRTLAATETRTLRTPYGAVKLVRTASRLAIADNDQAVAFLEAADPDAVDKTAKISRLSPETRTELADLSPDALLDRGFERVPAGDSMTIKTGVSS